jgi:hypothetical protein
MDKKLGILILHGMGVSNPDFADSMINKMNKHIKNNGFDTNGIVYQPCCWDEIMQPKEQELWNKVNIYNDLKWETMRRFCVNTLTDAVSYQESFGRDGGSYDQIHNYIYGSLKKLRDNLGIGGDRKPLIVIAHSLGCHVISNFIWDRQHRYQEEKFSSSDFINMRTLVGLITSGCNMPFFAVAYDDIQSIQLPSPNFRLYSYLNLVKWYNFYDKNDILAMPLKGLSSSYAKTVSEDVCIGVGSLFTSWNPLNHLSYREDNSFLKPVCKYICDVLKIG